MMYLINSQVFPHVGGRLVCSTMCSDVCNAHAGVQYKQHVCIIDAGVCVQSTIVAGLLHIL